MMTVTEIVILIFILIGIILVFIAALGTLKFPDVYARMSATSKAATLGVAAIIFAAGIYFHTNISIMTRAGAVIAFLFMTAPVSAHMLARAAYAGGVKLSKKYKVVDELEGRYDKVTHTPSGAQEGPGIETVSLPRDRRA
ncbi:MAG: monovalent cation/H(+) antiporter subunit G [Chloroflexaceae bacterium]|nr:monovalent cation/H(+) antiporter subunit G [Chloroflexaceae bacterium]